MIFNAFFWIFLSSLSFSIMGIAVKLISGHFSSNSLVFYRSAFNLVIFLPLFLNPQFRLVKKGSRVLLLRGLFGFLGVSFHYYALKHLPLGVAYLVSYMAPLFVIFFSYIFLKEKLSRVALLFTGVVMVGFYFLSARTLNGGASMDSSSFLPLLGALAGAICAAAAYTAVRAAGQSFKPELIVFYLSLVSVLFSFPLFLVDLELPQTQMDWTMILVMGVTATFAQVCLTKGYQFAKAGPVSVMSGMSSVFSLIWGYFIFNEILEIEQILGAILIFLGVSGLSLREERKRKIIT